MNFETVVKIVHFGTTTSVASTCDNSYLFIFSRDYGISVYNIKNVSNPYFEKYLSYSSV